MRLCTTRYIFTSIGRRLIKKVVEFSPIGQEDFYNLVFGDMQPDGSVSDRARSNNGDILKVLATVVLILKDFTREYRDAAIFFTGVTPTHNRMYARILRSYHAVFMREFAITCITGRAHYFVELPFDPGVNIEYSAFLVKRIA